MIKEIHIHQDKMHFLCLFPPFSAFLTSSRRTVFQNSCLARKSHDLEHFQLLILLVSPQVFKFLKILNYTNIILILATIYIQII